jgi:hypothetical protein
MPMSRTVCPLQQLRQLGDVGGYPAGLVAGEQIGGRAASWPVLIIHIRKRLAAAVLHDEASVVVVFDGPGRREATRGHVGFGP